MNILKVSIGLLLITNYWHYAFMWNKDFLLHYILTFSRAVQVEEFNWFISDLYDTKGDEQFQDFFNTVHREMMLTQIVITNNDKIKLMETHSKRRHLGVVMTTGARDPIMRLHDRATKRRHFSVNLIVLIKPLEDPTEADHLLYDLKRRNFVNTFLYVQYTNKTSAFMGLEHYSNFAMQPDKNVLENLNEKASRVRWRNLNCQDCKFYTPLCLDLPGAFSFTNSLNYTEEHGMSLGIMKQFAKNINGSLVVNNNMLGIKSCGLVVNMKDILKYIRSRKILISAHSYALFNPDEELDKCPSFTLTKWCLMVPIRNNVSYFYYPIIPYSLFVWCTIGISYITLAVTDCLLLWWENRKRAQQKFNLLPQIPISFVDNLCYLLFITSWKHIKRPSAIRFLLYATVFFHAFFISTGYSTVLGSILTVSLFKNEINTMEDLIRANLSTMIIDYELEFLLKLYTDLPKDFLKLIVAVDPATLHLHRTAFNQSFAYFVLEHQWEFLREQQAFLKPEIFKLTDICFGTYDLGYPMETDSPTRIYMEYSILRMMSIGLGIYFSKSAFGHALRAGYVRRLKPDNVSQASGLIQISMVFLMLIILSFVCIIVFLCECLHYRFKEKYKNHNRK